MNKYAEKTENEIIEYARKGDEEANTYIFRKYGGVINSIASNYFLMGSDRDDLIQEGRFGLYKAIRDFIPEKICSFNYFARICILRQIMAAIKKASGRKCIPLNHYISLDKIVYDRKKGSKALIEFIPDKNMYIPDNEVIFNEVLTEFRKILNQELSGFERKVIMLYIEKGSYENVATILKCEVKTVDNALQRARRKIKKTIKI